MLREVNCIVHDTYFFRWNFIMRHNLVFGEVAYRNNPVCLVHSLSFQIINMLIDLMPACPVKLCCMDVHHQWLVLFLFCADACPECHPVMAVYYIKVLFFCYFLCCKSVPVHVVKQCRAVNFRALLLSKGFFIFL